MDKPFFIYDVERTAVNALVYVKDQSVVYLATSFGHGHYYEDPYWVQDGILVQQLSETWEA